MTKINKEWFKNVIIFSLAEPGAMGMGGLMDFITEDGVFFSINYLSEETLWEEVKECFPALKGCCFNGPMENEKASEEIMIYPDESSINLRTRVNEGWKHIYMGFGNHLVVRDDHFEEFSKTISDLTDEAEIYGNWFEIAKEIYCRENNAE